ncbi:uncharacterized protein B0J16DRAFT_412445 [Fusarium flagelliforme]|uniref:uncharacterized protein n=1 Tax=Fusarium flagelliforme TaxID=2675880 RepID=UPI001E8D1A16|nr:uncharacterized protein B0J16DRAFT_412445 [Fusarium flagelliforme]KAH7193884.1 hypothetical protein B0J16DRAFT_412445 [Fusarium flagelliforme]
MHCRNILKPVGLVGLAVHVAAKPQQVARRNHEYIFPRATADPHGLLEDVKLLEGHGVKARRAAATSAVTLTLTIAPDETCGYLSGSVGVPITCENKALCTWEQDSLNVIACSTDHYLQCIESKTAVDPNLCNDVCQSDTWNLRCTDSDAPYCRTYLYPNGVVDYRCASTSVSAFQRVEHTFKGDDSPGFTTTTISDVPTMTVPSAVTRSSFNNDPTTTTDYPDTTSSTEVPDSPPKPVPVGAIVGGVVGGVAVLGLIAIGTIIALRRRKAKPTVDATISYQPNAIHEPAPMVQKPQPGPPHQQVFQAPVYDPSMASSPVQTNHHMSMASGSVSPTGPASPTGWNQYPSPAPVGSPAPAYEVAGPEAREAPSIHELGGDTSTRK